MGRGGPRFRRNEGTPLPPALKGRFAEEPRWIDVRPYREGVCVAIRGSPTLPPISPRPAGRPKEDLLSQEVRQQRRALRLAGSAVALWSYCSASPAGNGTRLAFSAIARSTTSRWRPRPPMDWYRPRPEISVQRHPAAVIADILNRARGLQDQLTAGGETSRALRYSEAGALDEIAYTLLMIGDTKSALAAAQKGTGILPETRRGSARRCAVASRPGGLLFANCRCPLGGGRSAWRTGGLPKRPQCREDSLGTAPERTRSQS